MRDDIGPPPTAAMKHSERVRRTLRRTRAIRNLGILTILIAGLACAVAGCTLAWRAGSESIAWATIGGAASFLLAVLWALFLTKLWCSIWAKISADYVHHVSTQGDRP